MLFLSVNLPNPTIKRTGTRALRGLRPLNSKR